MEIAFDFSVMRRLLRLFVWLGLSLAALASLAQDGLPGVFGEVIEIRVVNVEVVVSDRDGIRVRGLEPGDFRLWVDDEEVPIDYFSEVSGGEVLPSRVTDGGPTAVPAVRGSQSVGVSYLVFIDDFFGQPRDRNQVLEAIRQQLAYLGPDDRMAVVAYDGEALEMLTSWSQSPAALDEVLEEAARRPARGLERVAELRSFDRSFARHRDRVAVSPYQRLEVDEQFYVDRLYGQVGSVTSAAAATLRAFANPPGRKVALVLSGGWPINTATFVLNDFARVLSPSEMGSTEALFRHLVDTANLLGYTLYTVDMPGLNPTLVDSSIGLGVSRVGRSLDLRENEIHFGLDYMANRTGGKSFLNSRRVRVIEEVALDTKSFYWLGFTPKRVGSNEHHRIRVEVTNPRLEIRSRDGFLDYSRSTAVTLQVESALLFGNSPSSRTMTLELGEPVKAGRRKIEVAFSIAVPIEEIILLPVGDELVAELELRIAVKDSKGNLAPIPVIPMVVRRTEEPEPGAVAGYSNSIKLRREPHDIVVTVFDPVSGRIFAAEGRIEP